jgi:hypothetical protein
VGFLLGAIGRTAPCPQVRFPGRVGLEHPVAIGRTGRAPSGSFDNSPARRVIRCHFDPDPIADRDADVALLHSAA